MRPVNIYSLTRKMNIDNLQRFERQMSGRKYFLTVKDWEIESVSKLMEHLQEHMSNAYELMFYYSFQIPKLGKEFDLLRINKDTVINIELKSNVVPDEQVKKQLGQNRYYLSTLGLNMRSYTYISSEDRLLRLTGGGNIVEAQWEALCDDLEKQKNCYENDIEDLFKEDRYIISPLADPEKFLQKEYFLTSQQRDIERRILKHIKENGFCYQGFSGLPGTGKTLLLYDLAMTLSEKQKVAVFHCGTFSDEIKHLDSRLKRIDFFDGRIAVSEIDLTDYSAILVDEAHRMDVKLFEFVADFSKNNKLPVVFCYDSEDAIEKEELGDDIVEKYRNLPDYIEYNLTNRIRTNSELSAFVQCIMRGSNYNHRKEFPSVRLSYAGNATEANTLISYYVSNGYTFISDNKLTDIDCEERIEVEDVGRQEFDKVVMLMDSHFYYFDKYGLRSDFKRKYESPVRRLFHGLNRAKSGIAVVILDNEDVFEIVLSILQGQSKNRKNNK